MMTFGNRSTMIAAALALSTALLASAGDAQAKGGSAMTGIRTTGISTVSGGPTVDVRNHRGSHDGEGGVTITQKHRPCPVACSTGGYENWGKARVYDHRSH